MSQKRPNNDQHKSIFGNAKRTSENVSGGADWTNASPGLLVKLIDTITSRGGAVRFGFTRDGGAYALGLYYGGESTSEYCRPSESLDEFINKWIDFYADLPMSGGKAPVQ